jgi:dual specificity tyrosine-phosphorylation-regulated kinase 2/3/4
LLANNDIVHSDIKSENILIFYDTNAPEAGWTLKLIDYGSSFNFSKLQRQFSMATPEYMCPELLDFIIQENGSPKILPGQLD